MCERTKINKPLCIKLKPLQSQAVLVLVLICAEICYCSFYSVRFICIIWHQLRKQLTEDSFEIYHSVGSSPCR